MLSIIIILLIIAISTKNVTLLLFLIAHFTIYAFLNAYYSFVQINYLIEVLQKNKDYTREDWIDYLSPTNPRTLIRLWNHFYFDLFYLGVYIEYVIWKFER